eukprot:549321_1
MYLAYIGHGFSPLSLRLILNPQPKVHLSSYRRHPMSCSSTDEDPIVLIIHGHRYDVSEYADDHPGEGHNGMFLEDFDGKDVSEEFEYYHAKTLNANNRMLKMARRRGEWKKIRYLGPVDKPSSQSSGNAEKTDAKSENSEKITDSKSTNSDKDSSLASKSTKIEIKSSPKDLEIDPNDVKICETLLEDLKISRPSSTDSLPS